MPMRSSRSYLVTVRQCNVSDPLRTLSYFEVRSMIIVLIFPVQMKRTDIASRKAVQSTSIQVLMTRIRSQNKEMRRPAPIENKNAKVHCGQGKVRKCKILSVLLSKSVSVIPFSEVERHFSSSICYSSARLSLPLFFFRLAPMMEPIRPGIGI